MALLKYYDNNWINVGDDPHDNRFIPATGGTVEGPFPLVVDTGDLENDIVVEGETFTAGLTTTRQGSLDIEIGLSPHRTVDFGGQELVNTIPSMMDSSATTKGAADQERTSSAALALTLDPTTWVSSGQAYAQPMAKKNREGLVMLQGLIKPVVIVTAGSTNNKICVLPTKWRPSCTVTFSTFCSVSSASYCRVNIDKDGNISYSEGPTIPVGHSVSLDGISFYAI